jgi:hypothetical protein
MTCTLARYLRAGVCVLGTQLALACVETTPAVPASPVRPNPGADSRATNPVTKDTALAATLDAASSGTAVASALPTFERTGPTGPAACVLVAEPWLPQDEQAVLSLQPGGPGFVHVTLSAAEIEIPNGEANAVFVRMARDGWKVAGHLAASAFTLWPLRVIPHEGFLVTTGLSDLELVRAQPGELWLTINPPPIVRRAAQPVPEIYMCDEVNVGPPPLLDAEASLPSDPATRRRMKLRAKVIPLSTEPGSAPIAWIDGGANQEVVELERRRTFSRIALTGYTTLVFGWVSSRKLGALPRESEEAYGVGGLGGGFAAGLAKSSERPGRVKCDAELPVLARIGVEVVEVGRVEADTWVEATQLSDDWAELLPPTDLRLVAGASFITPRAAFSGCKSAARTPVQAGPVPP